MADNVLIPDREVYPFRKAPAPGSIERTARRAIVRYRQFVRRAGLDDWRGFDARFGETLDRFSQFTDDALEAGARSMHSRREDVSDRADALAFAAEAMRRATGVLPERHIVLAAFDMAAGRLAVLPAAGERVSAAALAAAAAAMSGLRTQVICNDEDTAAAGFNAYAPSYRLLGLRPGLAGGAMEPEVRHAAYRCDVTYVSARQVVTDHLTDRIALRARGGNLRLKVGGLHGRGAHESILLMPGLAAAVVEDADRVLLEEARAPVSVSGAVAESFETRMAADAVRIARRLRTGEDFEEIPGSGDLQLTSAGQGRVAEMAADLRGLWRGERRRSQFVSAALVALHALRPDREYTVAEGRLQIGEAMAQNPLAVKYWPLGLLRMIELREGLAPSAANVPLAQISLPDFYRRYPLLGAVCAEAAVAPRQIGTLYGTLHLGHPASERPGRAGMRLCVETGTAAMWNAVCERVRDATDRNAGCVVVVPHRDSIAEAGENLRDRGFETAIVGSGQTGCDEKADVAPSTDNPVLVVAGGDVPFMLSLMKKPSRRDGPEDVVLAGVFVDRRHEALVQEWATAPGTRRAVLPVANIVSTEDEALQAIRSHLLTVLKGPLPVFVRKFLGRAAIRVLQRRFARKELRARSAVVAAEHRRRQLLSFAGNQE